MSTETDPPQYFSAVPERNTGDNMLRTAQQHHVQLSMMADVKANIIITVSALVMTMTLARLNEPTLRLSAITLLIFTAIALMLAVLAVLPKYRPLRLADSSSELPPHFNVLFFGHFAELPRERFLEEVARAMKPDGSVYECMAKDIYGLGSYLGRQKYRYLRLSYLFFLSGFFLAIIEQIFRVAL